MASQVQKATNCLPDNLLCFHGYLSSKVAQGATQRCPCVYLGINEQRPAPSLADDDGIVNGEAVIREALDDPLAGLHRLAQHGCHGEVGGAGDVMALALQSPLGGGALPVAASEGACTANTG